MKLFYYLEAIWNFFRIYIRLVFANNNHNSDEDFTRCRNLVDYAWQYIPAYRSLWTEHGFDPTMFNSLEDLKRIPIIDKNFVRDHCDSMISHTYNQKRLSVVTTGGTTGMPMKFYIDNFMARSKELAYQLWGSWYYWKHLQGIDRVVTMRGYRVPQEKIEAKVFWERNKRENGLLMSSFHILEENYDIYISKLREYKPKFIKAYPSSIVSLCTLMKRHGDVRIPGLKGIICSSENVYDWQRRLIRDVLDVDIYSFYGHSEKAVCAFQNSKKEMEFIASYGHVEFLDEQGRDVRDKGHVAAVVVTGFDNKAFPFIRYNTNDFVEVASGNDIMTASCIVGREQEFVYDKYGNKVPFTCSDEPIWGIDGIVAYQYHQREQGCLELLIQITSEFDKNSCQLILDRARLVFVNFAIDILVVPEIERTVSGKFRYLVQNIC